MFFLPIYPLGVNKNHICASLIIDCVYSIASCRFIKKKTAMFY